MIEERCAIEIKEHALKAISELSLLLAASQNRCTEEEFEQLRIGVARAIGGIQIDLLDAVYSAYPELDDLK